MDYGTRERIGASAKMTMLMVAILFWVVSFIPIVNFFSDAVAWLIFWMWFKFRGASLSKKWKTNLGSAIVGLVPLIGTFISAMPYVIYLNIKAIQTEDEAFNAARGEATLTVEQEAYSIKQQRIYTQNDTVGDEYSEEQEDQPNTRTDGIRRYEPKPESEKEKAEKRRLPDAPNGDAYDELKQKPDKTREDDARLSQIAGIRRIHQISPADRSDPALLAAYEQDRKENIQSRQSKKLRPEDENTDETMMPMSKTQTVKHTDNLPKIKEDTEDIDEAGASRPYTEPTENNA